MRMQRFAKAREHIDNYARYFNEERPTGIDNIPPDDVYYRRGSLTKVTDLPHLCT